MVIDMAKLSHEQVEFACAKREAGWSTRRIGMRLGVSSSAINYQCLKHGAVSPRQRRTATPEMQHRYEGKDGRKFRTFTPDEDHRLLVLARQGLTVSQIGRDMARANTSVRMRIMMLELREDLPA